MAEEYQIIIQPEAYEGMENGYEYIEQDAPENAARWAVGLMDTISSLKVFPSRCALAPENPFFTQEIRQIFYGKGHSTYRILFTISENIVSILHIRHGAQDMLKPDT